MVSTWLYVPNLIGYVRILTGLAAFMYAFDKAQHGTFFMLYAFSYALDAVDGVAARALKQTSRFGAVLDMVTDRFCTAGLLAVLAHLFQEHPLHYVFIWLMILDIVSHWAQMYRFVIVSAAPLVSICRGPEVLGLKPIFDPSRCTVQTFVIDCSQLSSGASSHKTLQDEHPLLRFYYTFPYALFTVCLLNEACLLSFFLLKHEDAVESWM